MPELPTFCRVCEPACGLVARLEEGQVVGLRPDRAHVVSRGFACHKGIAALDVHRDPDRLDFPLRRGWEGFERCSWDDAVFGVVRHVKAVHARYGPDAVGLYAGNPTAFNSLLAPALGAFFGPLGTRRIFGSGTQDCANKFAGSEAVFGSSTIHPIPDLEHTQHLLLLGTNPRVSHMSFLSLADPMRRLREARRRGAVIRFVNPRRVESVEGIGEWIPIRPDTDVYLLAAMLCEIERGPGFREDVLREHGRGVEGLRAFVRRHPAERAAPVVGLPAETIRRLALEFAAAPSAAVQMSTGVNMGRQGTLAYWLVQMLSFVTGNLDRRGGNLYARGFYPAARSGRVRPEREFFESRYGRLRRIRGALPGNLLADEIEDPERPLRVLFVVAGNPLLSMGGEERLRRALQKLELLVCVDLYRNATGELAHVLLPAADMLERGDLNLLGLGMQLEPWVQWSDPVVAPRAERREEWWIFQRLAEAMGFPSSLGGSDPAGLARLDHMLAASELSLARLRDAPHGLRLAPLAPGRFYDDVIQTPDRRVDCCPPVIEPALARCEGILRELEAEPPDLLKLIGRRDPWMHNSWYHNLPRLKRPGREVNTLDMHPDDARERGLAEGALARVTSADGEVSAPLRLDPSLRRGVVAMSHGWGHADAPGMRVAQRHPGSNANALLPSGPGSFEPASNQAFMTGIPVRVRPAS